MAVDVMNFNCGPICQKVSQNIGPYVAQQGYIFKVQRYQVLNEKKNLKQFISNDLERAYKRFYNTGYNKKRGIVTTTYSEVVEETIILLNMLRNKQYKSLANEQYHKERADLNWKQRKSYCDLEVEIWCYKGEINSTQIDLLLKYDKVTIRYFEPLPNAHNYTQDIHSYIYTSSDVQVPTSGPQPEKASGYNQSNISMLNQNQNQKTLLRVPAKDEKSKARSYFVKVGAIINSDFEEVLYLDSDTIPITDPEYLFDDEHYNSNGVLIWPDYWKTQANNPIWTITDSEAQDEWEQESGQIVINKKKVLKALLVTCYMNINYHFYYKFMNFDKDTFRFGFKAIKLPYSVVPYSPGAAGQYIFKDKKLKFCGHSMIQLDPKGKILFVHANLLKLLKAERKKGNEMFGLISRYKPSKDQRHDRQQYLNAVYEMRYEQRWCVRLKKVEGREVEVIDFNDVLKDFEKLAYRNVTDAGES